MIEPLLRLLPVMTQTGAALSRLCSDRRLEALCKPEGPGWICSNRRIPGGAPGRVFGLVWSDGSSHLTVLFPEALDAAATAVAKASGWAPAPRLLCLESIMRDSISPVVDWAHDMGLALSAILEHEALLGIEGKVPAFTWQLGADRIDVYLHSDSMDWVQHALHSLASQPLELTALATLRLSTSLAFGWRRIHVQALRSLEVGDVLLAARTHSVHSIEHAFLIVGRPGLAAAGLSCQVGNAQITVLEGTWMNEQAMKETALTHSNHGSSNRAATDALASIEVDLHIELQVLSTPLAELARMKAGHVLELPVAAAEATVQLMVGGQVFGRAQLVCIGDRLGARIVELNHDAG